MNSVQPEHEDLERFVPSYTRPSDARRVDRTMLSFLVQRTIPDLEGPDVLEMGFGDGAWTGPIIERFGHSHLVDGSTELLAEAARLYGDKLTLHHSYFEDFNPGRLYDSVCCTYVLEHVNDPVRVMSQARTWLKPDGLLFVAVPSALSLHRRLAVRMGLQRELDTLGDSDHEMGHLRVYTPERLRADLGAAGFRVERARPALCKALPNGLMTHLSPAQLEGLFNLADDLPEELCGALVYYARPA